VKTRPPKIEIPRKTRWSCRPTAQPRLQAEYRTKSEKARLLRRKRAHIPELLEIETFPFARQPKLDRQPHLIYEGDGGGEGWVLALKRLLEIVNGLLEQAGSSERLYGIYGGNDGRVILLTPEMRDYIESLGDVFDSGWMPYPVEQLEASDRR